MKIISIIIFLFPIISLFPQNEKTSCLKKERYLATFNYIEADSVNIGKTIYVVDSIADLDKQWFREEINLSLGENKTIENYFKFVWEENQHSPLLTSLFKENKNSTSDKILIFSDIDDNLLLVEVWDRKRTALGQIDTSNTISWASRFTEGHIYLFIFQNNGVIKDVFRKFYISD